MARRWEIRQRFADGSVYEKPIKKAWTKKGAARLFDELEADRLVNFPNADWAFFGWDNLTGTPVIFDKS